MLGFTGSDEEVIARTAREAEHLLRLTSSAAVRTRVDGQITARRFESVVSGVAPKPKQVAPALNKAANDVAAQVADWVG